jgi:hypothetical protein
LHQPEFDEGNHSVVIHTVEDSGLRQRWSDVYRSVLMILDDDKDGDMDVEQMSED